VILGIDIDTTKLTICAHRDATWTWATGKLRRDRGQGSWLDAVQAVQAALAMALEDADLTHVAHEAYVERGWGANRNADYQLGAIFGATMVALPRCRPGIHVDVMTTHEWKRAVTAAVGIVTKGGRPGNANAPKETANSACRIILMEAGEDAERVNRLTPDELDSFGIAWTATNR
jgi:hypothetical protein